MMNQNIFETKQRASELLDEAVRIWQSSEQSEYLEGLDTDPVFKLLLNAIAYQANEIENDIESLKEDIFGEFENMMSRGEGEKAIPAMAVVTAPPVSGISDVIVDSNDEFFITGENGERFSFTPLFRTRSINASVQRVLRMDARRWAVTISFAEPVTDLSGFAFAVPYNSFLSLKVFYAGSEKELDVLSPFDYAGYPMAEYFSLGTVIYNRSQAMSTGGVRSGMSPYSSYIAVDLFARCLIDYYVVSGTDDFGPVRKLDLVFEFSGIPDTFSFSMKDIMLNPVILVNARRLSVNLSSESPIEKLTGSSGKSDSGVQFLHLLPPSDDSAASPVPVQVRRIGMERFNEGRLLKLLQTLIMKYSSDYYAFESIGTKTTDATMVQIQKNLSTLIHALKAKAGSISPGTYAYLDFHNNDFKFSSKVSRDKDISVQVSYLCTDGSAVNGILNKNTGFSGPQWVDAGRMVHLVEPVPGMDEVVGRKDDLEVSKYYLSTEDRIVTPYDIKVFCYKELQVRYGVVREMVENITVRRGEILVGAYRTYETVVTVTMKANEFTERAFRDRIEYVQSFLARMIWARTNGTSPLSVKLILSHK